VYLVVNGNKVAALTDVTGLESQSGVREIQRTEKSGQVITTRQPVPAPPTPGKVTARYVAPKTNPLASWRQDKTRQDVAIVLYGQGDDELSRFTLSKASLSQSSPAKPAVGQEVSITIDHEGLKLGK
jgi:hypothetical protein